VLVETRVVARFYQVHRFLIFRLSRSLSLSLFILSNSIVLWIVLTTGYFGLIVVLLAAMSLNQRHQKPPEVLIREHANEQHWDMR
jgi:hypothetical protein